MTIATERRRGLLDLPPVEGRRAQRVPAAASPTSRAGATRPATAGFSSTPTTASSTRGSSRRSSSSPRSSLCPLVAIQPIYMHPYTAAKMVASLGFLHERRIYLNMLAGGFKNDLIALNDETPHDDRYVRTVEYTQIMTALLSGPGAGHVRGQVLQGHEPEADAAAAGRALSRRPRLRLVRRRARRPRARSARPPSSTRSRRARRTTRRGDMVDVGRPRRRSSRATSSDEAWRVAQERFPEDRKGQITHKLAMKVSDSQWHKQLSELGAQAGRRGEPVLARPVPELQDVLPVPGRQLRARRPRSSRATSSSATRRSSSTSRRPRTSSSTPRSSFDGGSGARRRGDRACSRSTSRARPSAPGRGRARAWATSALTYGELEAASNRLARLLRRGGLRAAATASASSLPKTPAAIVGDARDAQGRLRLRPDRHREPGAAGRARSSRRPSRALILASVARRPSSLDELAARATPSRGAPIGSLDDGPLERRAFATALRGGRRRRLSRREPGRRGRARPTTSRTSSSRPARPGRRRA